MTVIFAKHAPYGDGHLGDVMDTMRHAGPPTIRCVWYGSRLLALEGSHRLHAAHCMGLVPRVVVLTPDSEGCDVFHERAVARLPALEFPFVWILDVPNIA